MTDDSTWLTVPDFADALGVPASHVRDLVREGTLVAVRRGPRETWQLPAGFIVDSDDGVRVLPTLAGTLTVLRDAGFRDDEVIEWLQAPHDDLGRSPLAALRDGQRAPVRRAAQALL